MWVFLCDFCSSVMSSLVGLLQLESEVSVLNQLQCFLAVRIGYRCLVDEELFL